MTKKRKVEVAAWTGVLDNQYADLYLMDTGLREAATIAASVMVSRSIPGDPLWIYLVGPPSTGKTVIVDSLSTDEDHCLAVSKLTSKTMVSGWVDPEDKEKDVSIFGQLRNKALLIKDFTAVMSMGGGVQEELYGMLRDCYDGKVKVPYGNGKVVEYDDIYFPLIAAVTDKIKGDNRANLGERFLRCEVLGVDHDGEAIIAAAMSSVVKDSSRKEKLAILGKAISTVLSRVERSLNVEDMPGIDPAVIDNIIALSQIVGLVRTTVDEEGDNAIYKARPEGGSRVAKQLAKLGISLACLLGEKEVDSGLYPLIRKVGKDTVNGYSWDILERLANCKSANSTDDLTDFMRMPKVSLVRHLMRLRILGAVDSNTQANPTSHGGRRRHVWTLSGNFRSLWNRARLNPEPRMQVV